MVQHDIDDIFTPGGRLSQNLPAYELRPGQLQMAQDIMRSLDTADGEHSAEDLANLLVVEAETGIGKTLGYLFPAVLSGKRLVVSTATITLQDQLLEKDIPIVEKTLGTLVRVECVKGRDNYLCLYRWFQFCSNPQLSLVENPFVDDIASWLKHTRTGDRAELAWLGEHSEFWQRISAAADQCLGNECPEQASCFVNQMRKRAGNADILIVNHHLFFSDMSLRAKGYGEVLPRYEAVILDEAHHLENIASNFFGVGFSGHQVLELLSDIEREVGENLPAELTDQLLSMAGVIKRRLEEFYSLFPREKGRFALLPVIEDLGQNVWQESIEQMKSGLASLVSLLEKGSVFGELWHNFSARAETIIENVSMICLFEPVEGDGFIRWYEKRQRTVTLSATPLDLDTLLVEHFYAKVDAVILCSATLSSAGSFSYITQRLGLPAHTEFVQLSSPFDYKNRVLFYVPESGFPGPAEDGYGDCLAERTKALLERTQGRALVLCTSVKSMERLAEFLEHEVPYPIFVQGRESRSALLEKFRHTTCSVLVAVASFWQGIDVSGESLSCVIIDKLPFDVPSDPVIQARVAKIKAEGGNPFFSFQLPRAVFTLKQGVGRLMRSATDSGVIAIMDTRLFTKNYGAKFLKSLPPAPVVRGLEEITGFLNTMDNQKALGRVDG